MMPVEGWLCDNVMGWDQLGDEEKRVLRDFPILWSYFEGWVTYPKTANPQNIASKVDALPAQPLQNLIATNAAYNHYRNRFFPAGQKAEIFETVGLMGEVKNFVSHTLTDVQSEPRQRLKAVLYIINRLRNNFLHGGKALYNFGGQRENFQHANATLMEVLPFWRAP
jgi:hypothetical protein